MNTHGVETQRRLEGGWLQRIVWAVVAVGSLGLLVWLPFLYVAIRRRRASDWGAFAAFALYECVMLWWTVLPSDDDLDALFGLVVIATLLTAAGLLLFAVFDRRLPSAPVAATPMPYGPPQGQHSYGPYGPYAR
ncbi:hypothetical protein ACFOOM_30105 [Streptomyces echinoruber]|jgi:hypothetical protein|uniref:Uncharacterized protein n=1 Tax=Streptomyces echinoruber TaxID=68898 RepID=A0A918RHH2_9ACTN|nr:hypothetical protein [Streptomyces echinoruber]GGZ99106.1 hypothetical protein GCM10010389_42890 [Streptomyces echinoruber]